MILIEQRLTAIDLWIAQRELDKQKQKVEEEKEKLKELVKNASYEELVLLMDDFYAREKKNVETEIPELVVFVIHELVDRDDAGLEKEEAPN